jgi:hypothetical protein
MSSQAVNAAIRESLGLPTLEKSKPTVPVEGHVCDFPLWSFSKKRSTVKELHITYEDGSFFHLHAPKGMPGVNSPGYLDVLLYFGQRDLFSQDFFEMSAYSIMRHLTIDPTDGRSYQHFLRDMERNFDLSIKTDRFINPATGRRDYTTYFRIFDTMEVAKHRKRSSRFYFNRVFLASLRAGYLKRLDFDFCLHLDRQTQPLARFLYAHLLKRIGLDSLYIRNLIGFLRDCGLSYIADLDSYRRHVKLTETVFPALDLLKGEAIHTYELDDQGNIFFLPKS